MLNARKSPNANGEKVEKRMRLVTRARVRWGDVIRGGGDVLESSSCQLSRSLPRLELAKSKRDVEGTSQ